MNTNLSKHLDKNNLGLYKWQLVQKCLLHKLAIAKMQSNTVQLSS